MHRTKPEILAEIHGCNRTVHVDVYKKKKQNKKTMLRKELAVGVTLGLATELSQENLLA